MHYTLGKQQDVSALIPGAVKELIEQDPFFSTPKPKFKKIIVRYVERQQSVIPYNGCSGGKFVSIQDVYNTELLTPGRDGTINSTKTRVWRSVDSIADNNLTTYREKAVGGDTENFNEVYALAGFVLLVSKKDPAYSQGKGINDIIGGIRVNGVPFPPREGKEFSLQVKYGTELSTSEDIKLCTWKQRIQAEKVTRWFSGDIYPVACEAAYQFNGSASRDTKTFVSDNSSVSGYYIDDLGIFVNHINQPKDDEITPADNLPFLYNDFSVEIIR
ncbi:MAG: hypothetical protein PHT19_12995 [Methylococcus sp.]|nr:hypothetical protein [Methylococcus sp.]